MKELRCFELFLSDLTIDGKVFMQVADPFIEDAGLNEEDEEGRDEEIEVP